MQVEMIKILLKIKIFFIVLIIGSVLEADPYSLANISQYLTNSKFLKADFSQTNAMGLSHRGQF